MSEVKLPEPFRKQGQKIAFDGCDCAQADYFVSAQLKQYGDDRAREALEMAAKVCDAKADRVNSTWIPHECASGIRALAKEIK